MKKLFVPKNKTLYFLCYTFLFSLFSLLVFSHFREVNASFVWQTDGLNQHYNAMLYYGRYLRICLSNVRSFLREGFPMWDFSLGLGGDIISALYNAGMGSPINLLAAFFSIENSDLFYSFIILSRLFLGGITFSCFALGHGASRTGTLVASMVYCFNSYTMILGLMDPSFLIPFVYYPLVLLGIDRIIERKGPAVFVISSSFVAFSNIHFFYILLILSGTYFCYRSVSVITWGFTKKPERKAALKDFLSFFARFLLSCFTVFLISAVLLFQSFGTNSPKLELGAMGADSPLYSLNYYLQLPTSFMNMENPGSGTFFGYGALGLLCLVIVFVVARARTRGIRFLFCLLTVLLSIPFLGIFTDGLSQRINIWLPAYSLCMGMMVSYAIGDLIIIKDREKRRVIYICFIYGFLCIMTFLSRTARTFASLMLLFLLCTGVVLWKRRQLSFDLWGRAFKIPSHILIGIVGISFLLLGTGSQAWLNYSVDSHSWVEEFVPMYESGEILTDRNADSLLENRGTWGSFASLEGRGDFYRIDESALNIPINSGLQRGVYTNSHDFPAVSKGHREFIDSLYLNTARNFEFNGFDGRAALEGITGVRHFLAYPDWGNPIPYPYSQSASGDTPLGKVVRYSSDKALSLGFSPDGAISRGDFDRLSVTDKERALTKAVVLEDRDFEDMDLPALSLTEGGEKVAIDSWTCRGNAAVSDNGFWIGNEGEISFSIETEGDRDSYLVIENLNFRGIKKRRTYNRASWKNLTDYQRTKTRIEDLFFVEETDSAIEVAVSGRKKTIEVLTPKSKDYCDRHDFALNLGDLGQGLSEVVLTFKEEGIYSFDSFSIESISHAEIAEGLAEEKKHEMTNVQIARNRVSGRVSFDKPRILVLSIPYAEGWRAYVDGEETRIMVADIAFMSIAIGEGDHTIDLFYETPMLGAGFRLSILGVLLLALICLVPFIRRKYKG